MTFYRNEDASPLCTIDLKHDKGNIRNKNCLRKITKLDKHKGKRKTEFISLHYTSVFILRNESINASLSTTYNKSLCEISRNLDRISGTWNGRPQRLVQSTEEIIPPGMVGIKAAFD